jgi:hypothetical protein
MLQLINALSGMQAFVIKIKDFILPETDSFCVGW